MSHSYSEDALVERPAIALFEALGWETADAYHETFGPGGTLGRETRGEVVLPARLQRALERLNPELPPEALRLAVEELRRDRSLKSAAQANREVYELLKDGVKVTFRDERGNEKVETVRVIDWEYPTNNDFLLVSQLWISGELHTRRPDLTGFVNGIPLVLIELKAAHKRLKNAYQHNLRDYKDTIPHLFWYNAAILLSNGSDTVVGSMTAPWEHFNEWKKINSEGEEGVVSLETAIRGVCDRERLADLVENFTLFAEVQGGLIKLIAKNHQYLGVNNAFQALRDNRANQGKLGVFWHTQGSGKSYAMIFFAQKVLRKLPGNWTFAVVTDRRDLDDQIYKNFAAVNAVTEPEDRIRAQSGEHLQQLLREDHRYVFTLIQKFYTEKGEKYPTLSERDDVIVMTDEAHRSQYDVLALNMRNALPNAAYLAFTGTPLIAGEERTREVFGDYVSIYNFAQSVADRATVPLYYENRIPELQLTNTELNRDMERLLEDAELDESQETRLEREFAREYHLITRNDRLEKIAEDIVLHFMGRGFPGKAMVIAVDKATTVRMFDKVQKYWKMHLAELLAEYEARTGEPWQETRNPHAAAETDREARLSRLWEDIRYMQTTDMAVVISQSQNEIADMQAKGLDIKTHRRRMLEEDLETKFKDPADPFRIVFVTAMWMTGFDVPSCSTIYLDKPMRNHTLMQTIARANRVWGEKVNGLIVDYIGVFRDLQRALAIYGTAAGGGVRGGDLPVETKQALVEDLRAAIEETRDFLAGRGIELEAIHAAEGFERLKLIEDGVDALVANDDTKRHYLGLAERADRLFHAILPDPAASAFGMDRKAIVVLADRIRALTPAADISGVMEAVGELLDDSIVPSKAGYMIHEPPAGGHYLDLSKIDFEALRRQFERGHKHIEIEKLRGQLNAKMRQMVRLNRTRLDYYQKFQTLIEEYNAGAKNADATYAELISFAQSLSAEEQRHIAENLSEEELALFDLLTRPKVKLSRKERQEVKAVARELLDTLKAERLVIDWRKHQQTRAAVEVTIRDILDKLPQVFDDRLYEQKCQTVFQHVYENYYGEGRSVYGG